MPMRGMSLPVRNDFREFSDWPLAFEKRQKPAPRHVAAHPVPAEIRPQFTHAIRLITLVLGLEASLCYQGT
jgi:hypothetical protein